MATVLADPDVAIRSQLDTLSSVFGVQSVQLRRTENVLHVWIGVQEDDEHSRDRVYEFEDSFLKHFQNLPVEFHVVTMPAGRKMQDFISDAETVFQRVA